MDMDSLQRGGLRWHHGGGRLRRREGAIVPIDVVRAGSRKAMADDVLEALKQQDFPELGVPSRYNDGDIVLDVG